MKSLTFAVLVACCLVSSTKADIVYDTYSGVNGFEAPTPFAPRILDSINLNQSGSMELDGLRLGFTVTNAPQDLVVFVQFWDNIDFGSNDPLANAVSLGTQGINFGSQTQDGGFGSGISSGLAANGNDIILPGNTDIGVEFRFRLDGSNFQPNISGRLVNAPNAVGTTTTDYYIDSGLDGFGSGDLVSKGGKVLRFEISTVPEPSSLALLTALGAVGFGLKRRKRS